MKNLFLLDEEEKNRILNLHEESTKRQYLTLEQTNPVIRTTTDVTFKGERLEGFNFGDYESEIVKNSIAALKPKIMEFIKNSKNDKFVVNISAGESNVTNPKGFEVKGSLALARANSVKKYFEEVFSDLIKRGILKIKSPKDVSEVVMGKTPYDKSKGDNKNPQLIKKYKEEQFVKFNIDGIGEVENIKNICNWVETKTAATGNLMVEFVSFDEKLQGNGNLTFNTGSIPDRMIVVDKQNNIKQDTGYITTENHKYTIFKYVPLYVSRLTGLYNKSKSVSGSKIITIKANSIDELISQILVPGVTKLPEDSELKKIGESEVYNGIKKLKELFNKGVREFVVYRISNSQFITIPYSSDEGDYKAMVYSPMGSTGYTIKGECLP
jgi:hypothetical protein